jgi:hypothetical protein
VKEISGKSGTVKFDIDAADVETTAALEIIISNTLKTIVDKDSRTLIEMITAKPSVSRQPRSQYARENLEAPVLMPLGGEWTYSVALTEDSSGGKSVQICKGKILGNFHKDQSTGKMILKPDDPMNPITKANKINIKRLAEWAGLQKPVLTRLKALEST